MINVKKTREFLGFNIADMVRACGVDRGLWNKWERETQRITAAPIRLLEFMVELEKDGILRKYLEKINKK